MSRHKFGGMVADWAFSFNSDGTVSQAGGAVLTFWDSLSGGTQYTAAPLPGGVDDGTGLLDGTGTPVSAVTCDGNGEIPDALQGPDGVYRMAADASGAGTGPRRWLYANDIGNDLTTLLAEVAGLPAAAQAPAYAYYDTTLATYPARPAVTAPVWWVGPVAPPVGGTGASGSDVWLNTTGATAPGGVTSVTAGDASVVVGGTSAAPALETASLDVIVGLHPAAADWSNNGHKIINGAPGVASTDFATVGQVSSGSGTLTPTPVKTAAYTAVAGDFVLVSTASAPVTVTLPAAPADGSRAGVKMVAQGGSNAVTVAAGGSNRFNVAGGVASLSLIRRFQTVTVQYQASAGLWLVTGADLALALDTSAADIQPIGTGPGAGALGLAADAGHVHPASAVTIPADLGVIAWAGGDPYTAGASAGILSAGKLMLVEFWVRKTATISTIGVNVATAPTGTLTSGQNLAGIYDSAGNLKGQTADQSAVWNAAGTYPMTLVSSFSAAPGAYWVAFLGNGTGTAPVTPNLRGASGNPGFIQLGQSAAVSRVGVYGSALTALPATITPASIVQAGANPYVAVIY